MGFRGTLVAVFSSWQAMRMDKSGSTGLMHASLSSKLVSNAPPAQGITFSQAEQAIDRGLEIMYSDSLPGFVPAYEVLHEVVSSMVSSVFSTDEPLMRDTYVSMSVWSYRVLFPDLPVGEWCGDNQGDTPPEYLMPRVLGVPVWYRECDMGLSWDDEIDSLNVSVKDSQHDMVSLMQSGDCVSRVFIPPRLVSQDISAFVVFDGLRKSGLSHLDACAALASLL
jgi:hypothetical protein